MADDTFEKYQHTLDIFQDEDDAFLRLAFLKEHSDYRIFFTPELRMEVEAAYLRMAVTHAQDEELSCLPDESKDLKTIVNFHRGLRRFGIRIRFDTLDVRTKEWLDVLDPRVGMKEIPSGVRRLVFSDLFYTLGVQNVLPKCGFQLGSWQTYDIDCAPYQRFLKIDLRKKPAQLLHEFQAFLRNVDKNGLHDPKTFEEWEQDRTRKRKERWTHLDVWYLRRQVPIPSFREIAQKLQITPSAAKKSFYRAYELIYGKPFDRIAWEKDQAENPSRTCVNCSKREGCTDPCPEIFDMRNSTREGMFEKLEEISDAYSYREWSSRKEDDEE